MILERLMTFLIAFSILILKHFLLKVVLSVVIHPWLTLISWHLTIRYLAATSVGSVGAWGVGD